MNDVDNQETLVRRAYYIQWAALLFPPTILASLIYLLVIRDRVTHPELRSHVNWQLTTCAAIAAMVPITLLLLVIAMTGFNTDSTISIIAAFTSIGASVLFLPWCFYRLLYGSVQFFSQRPMKRLFP